MPSSAEQNIDELVFSAQAGNQEDTEILLRLYGWHESEPTHFIGKYYDLLLYGKINLRDKDTRRFLQLYMKEKHLREKLTYHYQDYVGALAAQEAADYLQNKATVLERDELLQELLLLFLETVHAYKKQDKQIDFSGYLYNSYRYKVFHYLRKKVFKFDVLQDAERIDYVDEEIEDPKANIEPQESWFDRFYASDLKRDDLGIFWINGRCGSLFEDLSVFERTVLRDRYFYKQTDGEIAKRYGYHINTIYNRRHRALEKLTNKKRESFS